MPSGHPKYTVVTKSIGTQVFSPAKNAFKSVISIFCCCVPVGNISLHFQTFINCNNPVRRLSDNSQCSTQRSDLLILQSVWSHMKKQSKPSPTQSRRTVETSPRCFKKHTSKAPWKTEQVHLKLKLLQHLVWLFLKQFKYLIYIYIYILVVGRYRR